MKSEDLKRLIKIEDVINRIARDELGLSYPDIEYDICPSEKFLEIQAYNCPVQISHWSYGKKYDKLKTVYDEVDAGMPYEVVIDSVPPRAYLSNKNVLAVHALVIAHVTGHVHFFRNNRFYATRRNDVMEFLSHASERFKDYERKYGIDNVEPIIDAGLALQLHSSPFDNETENQKLRRVYEQKKKAYLPQTHQFSDLFDDAKERDQTVEAFNNDLWLELKNQKPVEPTEDFLRFIIDNSTVLDDWQKDILEILREEGRYYWPNIKCRLMNEGFATLVHERIMNRLFAMGLLDQNEHGQFAIANALVKAESPFYINPYLVGSKIFEDVIDRWDKGKHGDEWEKCRSINKLNEWDTKEGKGWERALSTVQSYNDWMFLQDYLTNDLVDELNLFIYAPYKEHDELQLRRTEHTTEEIRQLIISSYAHTITPKIEIIENKTKLVLFHSHFGSDLDFKYASETMKHVNSLMGKPVELITKNQADDITISVNGNAVKISNMEAAVVV